MFHIEVVFGVLAVRCLLCDMRRIRCILYYVQIENVSRDDFSTPVVDLGKKEKGKRKKLGHCGFFRPITGAE